MITGNPATDGEFIVHAKGMATGGLGNQTYRCHRWLPVAIALALRDSRVWDLELRITPEAAQSNHRLLR